MVDKIPIDSMLRAQRLISARVKAEECIALLKAEAESFDCETIEHAVLARNRFWELIRDAALEQLRTEKKPPKVRREDLAQHQRGYSAETVETVHGGRVIRYTQKAVVVEIAGQEHVLPSSLVTPSRDVLAAGDRFEALWLPE